MTKEELATLLQNDAVKPVLAELGYFTETEVQAKLTEETEGLKRNRDTFRAEKEKLKGDYENVRGKFEKTINMLKAHENFVDESGNILFDNIDKAVMSGSKSKAGGESDEYNKLQITRLQAENKVLGEQLTTKLGDAESFIEKLLVKDELRKALAADRTIHKDTIDFLVETLSTSSGAKVVRDDQGNRRAITPNGKTVEEFYVEWKETPAAKAIRIAEQNGGGGAGGGTGGSSNKSFKDMTPTERLDLYKRDQALYERLENQK